MVPNKVVMLLAPHHSGEGLSLDISEIIGHGKGAKSVVELVRLFPSSFNDIVKLLFIEVGVVPFCHAKSNN